MRAHISRATTRQAKRINTENTLVAAVDLGNKSRGPSVTAARLSELRVAQKRENKLGY
jgi:hypothetical protein